MPNSFKELLDGNEDFVRLTTKDTPDFFAKLAKGQHPEYLWIGCSDSRVPAEEITSTLPGQLFVHRNIANVVIHTDTNVLSVVYYAVKVLHIKHIIVCGHYGCGGVEAAMSSRRYGYIDSWLAHIKDVYRLHNEELGAITDPQKRFDRLVELNVMEQANSLASIPFIQEEWEQGEFPYIHCWVYDLKTGHLNVLDTVINSANDVDRIFQYQF